MKQLKLKVAKCAEDTWAQKSGSSEDIAQLYLAMLRAAGLTAYAMTWSIARAASLTLTIQASVSSTIPS